MANNYSNLPPLFFALVVSEQVGDIDEWHGAYAITEQPIEGVDEKFVINGAYGIPLKVGERYVCVNLPSSVNGGESSIYAIAQVDHLTEGEACALIASKFAAKVKGGRNGNGN